MVPTVLPVGMGGVEQEWGCYILCGWAKGGMLSSPRDLPVLKRSEGLCWVTAEKNRTFWKGVEGQRGKNRMAKRDLLANVSWLSMSSIPLLPCSPWANLEHFSGGRLKHRQRQKRCKQVLWKLLHTRLKWFGGWHVDLFTCKYAAHCWLAWYTTALESSNSSLPWQTALQQWHRATGVQLWAPVTPCLELAKL